MPGNVPRPVNARWATQRLSLFYAVFLLLTAALLVRLVNLGIVRGEYYARLSEENFLRTRVVDAPRGAIFDRDGEILAYNRATFVVSMSPGNLTTATIQTSLDRLAGLLGDDLSGYYQRVVGLRPRWKSRVLRRRLTLDQATAVLEQRYNLPGVAIETRWQRNYPGTSTLCHVLGHVGKIGPRVWPRYQQAGYEIDDDIGVTGIEAAFEDPLKGVKGREQVWKTSRGRILSSQILEPPVPGDPLLLTIDLNLQRLAESLLLGQKGVILAVDPRDGEVLVWASSPGYNLNRPAEIVNPADKPLINRVIQEYYQPGSTFKILTALAALEAGWTPDRRVTCERRFYLPNWKRPFNCLRSHGPVDLVGAFRYSCNIYFYAMADFLYHRDPRDAGYQLVRVARRYGLEDFTGFAIQETRPRTPGFEEETGRLPTPRDLRSERGSLLHLAIGQGRIDVTPLQILMAYAALANGGELLVPCLVRKLRNKQNEIVPVSKKKVRRKTALNPDHQQHRRVIVDGLLAAVNEPGGTAHGVGFLPQWRVAGKTSTAQRGGDLKSDAWFVGFAPAERPELVVLVMVEHGGHGGKVAAPLAARLFARYFDSNQTRATVASRNGRPL